ncbi:MAG TPA: YbfB/YjiJ family MFS transporter [Stellaceae bacterium]|nr:YbfB/YjiJ family MFS transporter [Stellaceae bacterium]
MLATLNAVGLSRFAYTPLVPFLIAAGVVTETGAAYLGAANLAGYLSGAAAAAPLAARIGIGRAIRTSFAISIFGLAACIWPGGFWWYAPWRFIVGVTGAVLMVLAPSFLLAEMPAGERGRSGGVIYTGVGIGIALSSLVVPSLAGRSVAWAWAALAAGALLTALATWPRWRGGVGISRAAVSLRGLGLPAFLVAVAFGMDGIGFIPHMLFWVDYIARSLALGTTAGALQWLLFGMGALLGPWLGGLVGDRIGIGRALILAFALKSAAVLLPALSAALPLLTISSVLTGAFTPGIAALSAARMSELVEPGRQIRAWGFATLVFGLFQAAGAYGMAYAYDAWRSYVPLYAAGAGFEAVGALCAAAALLLAGRTKVVIHQAP